MTDCVLSHHRGSVWNRLKGHNPGASYIPTLEERAENNQSFLALEYMFAVSFPHESAL